MKPNWVMCDFNNMLESNVVFLTYDDVVHGDSGAAIAMRAGLRLTIFDFDADEEMRPQYLYASGVVEEVQIPAHPNHRRFWQLRIDSDGFNHEYAVGKKMCPRCVHSTMTRHISAGSVDPTGVNEREAEPGATDNPDDAQRLREDH